MCVCARESETVALLNDPHTLDQLTRKDPPRPPTRTGLFHLESAEPY